MAGEFSVVTMKDRHAPHPPPSDPPCTHSQLISYRDQNGQEVARVHQYVRPDNKIGASDKPDPKMLVEGGVLYALPVGGGKHRR